MIATDYIFGLKSNIFDTDPTVNLWIGGVGTTITTKTELATVLNINASNIGFFDFDGINIAAAINEDYSARNMDIQARPQLTYYIDLKRAISTQYGAFSGTRAKLVYLKELTFLRNSSFANVEMPQIYLPKITSSEETPFNYAYVRRLYISQAMAANSTFMTHINAVAVEIISTYNLTIPIISSLQVSKIFCTGAVFNISVTNNILFYEFYINNKLHSISKECFLTKLTPATAYSVKVAAVDEYLNRSAFSVINITTLAAGLSELAIMAPNFLIDFEEDLISNTYTDKAGNYNCTGSNKNWPSNIGNGYNFKETHIYYPSSFLATSVNNLICGKSIFTIFAWVKYQGSSPAVVVIGAWPNGYFLRSNGQNMELTIQTSAGRKDAKFPTVISNTDHSYHLWLAEYDGTTIKGWIDNVESASVYTHSGSVSIASETERLGKITTISSTQSLSMVGAFFRILTPTEKNAIWNSGKGIIL